MQKVTFLIAASLGLAGCGTLPANTSMYSVHQPIVERTNYAIDLASDGDGIAVADQTRVNEWFDVLDLRYGDRISIDSNDSDGNEDAARDVRAAAAERGVMVTQGAPATAGVIAPGNIRELAAAELAAGRCTAEETKRFLGFFAGGKRSFARARSRNRLCRSASPTRARRWRAISMHSFSSRSGSHVERSSLSQYGNGQSRGSSSMMVPVRPPAT